MFDTATNATSTPIVPQDRFIAECVNLEEAPPYAPPGEQPKPGARPGIRWILALYDPRSGQRFHFQDEPYEFFQTTTANMQRGARAREYAEAFLGREIAEGEKVNPNDIIGKKCMGMVIHEVSPRDKTKKNAKLVAVEPLKTTAPSRPAPTQVSANPSTEEIDRATVVTDIQKAVKTLSKLNAEAGAQATAAVADSELDTAPLGELHRLLSEIQASIEKALDD